MSIPTQNLEGVRRKRVYGYFPSFNIFKKKQKILGKLKTYYTFA